MPQENGQETSDHGQDIAALLPAVVGHAAANVPLDVTLLREQTCLRPEAEQPQTRTAWIGRAAGPVSDPAQADAALDSVSAYLTGEGWERKNETTAGSGDIRKLYFIRGDLGATAAHHRTADDATIVVTISGPCLEHPEEHRMVRSSLDPDYGRNSQYYDDGAASGG